jgi:hypothetical protein
MNLDDTPELRDKLSTAWRSIIERLIAAGHPFDAVAETMLTCAADTFVEKHGARAYATYLRLLADQVMQAENESLSHLIKGDGG